MSLRARLLVGAALWTVGLFVVTHVLYAYPDASRILHAPFRYVVPMAIALVCLLAGFWLVRNGIAAMDRLRTSLAAVHQGREHSVNGTFPSEVQPLVNDLNALLDHRERAVSRAIAKAGDLAHGLKTPLAVIEQEARRARAAGHPEFAETVEHQAARMRRQVEYYLAHARAAASGATPGARSSVAESISGLARTLERLHAERRLTIRVDVPKAHVVRVQREDLDEMLGNLLDNACKWTRSVVSVCAAEHEGYVEIIVDDDGSGVEPSMREVVLHRGVRADEAAPGSGLGLAIVRELAEVYSGSIALSDSPSGGLRAHLRLPAA